MNESVRFANLGSSIDTMSVTDLRPGMICRSREPLMRCASDDEGRLCRVICEVAETRRRQPEVPEYKVELLAFPVTAFRRVTDLEVVR
jgi:hypothetical protein